MSRPALGAIAAAIIAVLTATAYFVTSGILRGGIERDVKLRVAKAQELLIQNSSLEMLGLLKRTEALARDPGLVKALVGGSGPNPVQAEQVFQKFRASLSAGEDQPDIMALTDEQGRLVALVSGDRPVFRPIPDTYLRDGKIKYPGLQAALGERRITSEVWDYENLGPMKAGVAPVYDPEIDNVVGAMILAYAMSATEARAQQKLLGTDVAYFYGDRVSATSFGPSGSDNKQRGSAKQQALAKALFQGRGLAKAALSSEGGLSDVVRVELDGDEYWATAGRMPRFATQPFPQAYTPVAAGALVMMSLGEAMEPLGTVKLAILLVGLGSIVVALLSIFITARRILHPIEEIELGVSEIINGNMERTFRPVGSDLDGLANALNVMLARLLGRPEPGDEEYDEEGNVVRPSGLAVDTDGLSAKDAEAVALAAEPEGGYLRRLFDEYVAARNATGEGSEGLTFDGFVSKLRQNETVLRAKYQCSAVRFKVVTRDGRVTLKPVPIL
ncbi:MAG TPA: MXAN_5187 C-terminal domain-containing protein [Kofleriaceae bacterium]|nr:MXAN_5187 C-terminal domain-containing protein [Kofleriaceae bacterium]